jgi:hypothetical protein
MHKPIAGKIETACPARRAGQRDPVSALRWVTDLALIFKNCRADYARFITLGAIEDGLG